MMQKIPKARLFLVGSPRSGTTLLQSFLAAHPEVVSFPESHFFSQLIFPQRRWRLTLGALGLPPRKIYQHLKGFLREIQTENLSNTLPRLSIFSHQIAHSFIKVLDESTQHQGKTVWLEKTPGHLHYIRYIQHFVPDARFIHAVRNGEDVVASQYEVTHLNPEIWGGKRSIDQCVQRWNKDIQISQRFLNHPNHTFVRYEDFVANPQTVLRQLCHFIGIEFHESMLRERSAVARQIVLPHETWKASVDQAIQSKNRQKFYQLFKPEQRAYIRKNLLAIDMEQFSLALCAG